MKNFKDSQKGILFLILIILLLLPAAVSCQNNPGNNGNSNAGQNNQNNQNNQSNQNNQNNQNEEKSDTAGENPPDTAPGWEYAYPAADGGGRDFTFFSPIADWGYYTDIIRNEITGEILDDTIYNRNRFIEQQFNIELKAVERDIGEITGALRRVIASGDAAYDAAYVPAFFGGNVGALINDNMLYNLYDIPAMNLDREWYNRTMLKEAALGKGRQVYYVGCDINIMTVQSVVFIYFNQDMMSDLGIELPYNAVREGKWTYDLFYQYMGYGTNLNGAESFRYDPNGQTTYGFAAHGNGAMALFEGSGERFIFADPNGIPQLAIEGERFLNALGKVEDLLVNSPEGYFLYAADNPHFETALKNGRSLMITGELKAADAFRDMEATFGIAPMPKFDEYQENYFCHNHFGTPVLVVPNTNTEPDFTGAIIDAMAYLSAKDVTPVLFDVSVSQKRLRNEESIEMLQIIKNSGSFDVGSAYGWTTDFYNSIMSTLGMGRTFSAASQIERSRDKIIANIEKTMEIFE